MNQKQADSHRHRKWHGRHTHSHSHTHSLTHTLPHFCISSLAFFICFVFQCVPIGTRCEAAFQVALLERESERAIEVECDRACGFKYTHTHTHSQHT